jgi:hypothetical protein
MMTHRHLNPHTKPPPPPGPPTLKQRFQQMQFAAQHHKGNVPEGVNVEKALDVRKIVLPPEAMLAAGKVPNTIVISEAPEIHFDYEQGQDDDQTNDELSFTSNGDVFRLSDDDGDSIEDGESQKLKNAAPRPCIQRQQAFAFLESHDSADETIEMEPPQAQSMQKSSRPRFQRGFMAFVFRAKTKHQHQK